MSGAARGPKSFTREELEELYGNHPISEKNILARLERAGVRDPNISPLDLARDPLTEITDQNHVGGYDFVSQLGHAAGVSAGDAVLDLCCGLGGSARLLAFLFGARVHGIDLSAPRIAQGQRLTSLVRLESRVTLECADIRRASVPEHRFDVLWGQSAWVHLEDRDALLARWVRALRPGGRLALEDACLAHPPRSRSDRRRLVELEEIWKAHLVPQEDWISPVERLFTVEKLEDLAGKFERYFARLAKIAGGPGRDYFTAAEIRGCELAVTLAQAGVLGYFRLVARIRPYESRG